MLRDPPRGARLDLAHVGDRIFVHDRNSGEVPRLEGGEGDRELMAALQPGQAAEVGQALAFLLGHVIAVGQVRRTDGGEPIVGADLMARDFGDRVPDLVVVMDGVEGLSLHPGRPVCGQAYLQQGGVEDLLLGRRVQLEEHGQPVPYRGQHPGIRAVDLLQDRELPPLLVVVIENQLGNVHSLSWRRVP